jgi:hypothetical protein
MKVDKLVEVLTKNIIEGMLPAIKLYVDQKISQNLNIDANKLKESVSQQTKSILEGTNKEIAKEHYSELNFLSEAEENVQNKNSSFDIYNIDASPKNGKQEYLGPDMNSILKKANEITSKTPNVNIFDDMFG